MFKFATPRARAQYLRYFITDPLIHFHHRRSFLDIKRIDKLRIPGTLGNSTQVASFIHSGSLTLGSYNQNCVSFRFIEHLCTQLQPF